MSSSLMLEPATRSPGPLAEPGQWDDSVTLRISGGKPLHMRAELLAECSSWSDGAPAWHELALYRRDSGDFAVGVKTCRTPMNGSPASGNPMHVSGSSMHVSGSPMHVSGSPMHGSDIFHARIFPDLDTALGWVQAFDPTADLGADIDSSDRRISTTDIALRAATLRQHTDRVEQQYRAMVGELLYRMDVGE